MAHIYWELHEIPQPEGSYVNRSDGRVFLMSDDGNGKSKRRVIGHASSDGIFSNILVSFYLFKDNLR